MKILVDSSCWIDFFRDGIARNPALENAIRRHQAMLCPVVWAELWSGVRGKREEATLKNLLECCGWLDIDDKTWSITAELRRAARQQGLNCPLADVLIAACARRHGVELLHSDKHLTALMKLKF
jgi:predicted nucleic acid-binding protein